MSTKKPHWRDMGISDDELFTPKGLPYWQEIDDTHAFLAAIIHEIAGESGLIQDSIEILQGSEQIDKIKFDDTLNGEKLCDIMWSSTEKIKQIVLLMLQYNRTE